MPTAVVDALRARADSQGEVRLIVQFAAPGKGFAELPATARPSREQQIANLQASLASRALQPGMRELVRFRTIPFMVFSADANAVDRLAGLPEVIDLQEDIPEYPTLASSIPIIGADTAWTAGFDGTGQVIAVLDTGVDTSHPYFPPAKRVAEACFSSNDAANSQSLCPGQASSSTAAGSGQNCTADSTLCPHGTHVAGIAAGNNGSGPNIGVAKEAGLIAIQVFSCISGGNCPNLGSIGSYPSDQTRALEHVLLLSQSFDIAAVNMSLGGAVYQSQEACDDANALRKAAIDNLRAVGIATIIASGNDGSKNAVRQPGCISSAISVG
ncbi:MAG TPA: S8 family serine peptidase, partial [Xanthomonadales bacterium]|nr:S8 family serine peptidase [Xanthomonadales bacterium]